MSKLGIVACLLVLCVAPADAATRKQCRAKVCRGEIDVCKASCNFPIKTIHAQAKIGCDTSADCLAPEVCTPTDPSSPTDFGNAFAGWSGQSCVLQQ